MIDQIADLIRRHLPKDEAYAFLCGSGISVMPPSCLPTGAEFVENIFTYLCLPSAADDLVACFEGRGRQVAERALRFEAVIQALEEVLDPDLHILDTFLAADAPNMIHRFLASCVENGHSVFTTNFDRLIELCRPQQLCPIATDEDFMASDHVPLPVFKLHGNFFDRHGKPARSSIVASLGKILQNGRAVLSFAKATVLSKQTKGRTIIVLGYSGSDDYDIMPALTELTHCKGLIWVGHTDNGNLVVCHPPFSPGKSQGDVRGPSSVLSETINKFHEQNLLSRDRVVWTETDTGVFVRLLGEHLLDNRSFAPSSSDARQGWQLDIAAYEPFAARQRSLSEEQFAAWKVVMQASVTEQLFAFLEDWLNADLALETAFPACYALGEPAELVALLETSAEIHASRRRFKRALHFYRQAMAAATVLNQDMIVMRTIHMNMGTVIHELEKQDPGYVEQVLGKKPDTPASFLDEDATLDAMLEQDLESVGMIEVAATLLLRRIDRRMRGTRFREEVDVDDLLKKATLAVDLARKVGDPVLLMRTLERQCIVGALSCKDMKEPFSEFLRLRRILGHSEPGHRFLQTRRRNPIRSAKTEKT